MNNTNKRLVTLIKYHTADSWQWAH